MERTINLQTPLSVRVAGSDTRESGEGGGGGLMTCYCPRQLCFNQLCNTNVQQGAEMEIHTTHFNLTIIDFSHICFLVCSQCSHKLCLRLQPQNK